MPVYEYRCQACSAVTSLLVRTVQDPASPVCSTCGGTRLSRVISPFTHKSSGEVSRSDPLAGRLSKDFQRMGVPMPKELTTRLEAIKDGEP